MVETATVCFGNNMPEQIVRWRPEGEAHRINHQLIYLTQQSNPIYPNGDNQ
jgi:hypothetical protein